MANFGNVQNLPFSFFSVRCPNLFLWISFRNGERHFQLRLLAIGLRPAQNGPVITILVQLCAGSRFGGRRKCVLGHCLIVVVVVVVSVTTIAIATVTVPISTILPSKAAVKKQATTKITTIKLDKNFDIKVKGVKDLLEQGYDENRGMKYYKLYYEEEK